MRPQLLMACVAIFLIGTVLSVISSTGWLLSGEVDVVNALASFNTMSVQAGGVWNAPKTLGTYWNAMITILKWDYPFLSDAWPSQIKFGLWIISIGAVWGILQLFVSIIQGLVSVVRSLLPGV